ncbi:MAG: hypothetical protein NVS3B5_21240 [Sphingomicrobium sp.]
MQTPTTHAGGPFLTLAIVAGTIWGVATGRAMLGVLGGTGAGIAIAVSVWLVDRRRRNSR